MYKTLAIISFFLLASCGSLPKHNEIRGDDQPSLAFSEDGYGSQLYVDGNYVGTIDKDHKIFNISTGSHNVRIVKSSGQVVERTVFVQGNTRRSISLNNQD